MFFPPATNGERSNFSEGSPVSVGGLLSFSRSALLMARSAESPLQRMSGVERLGLSDRDRIPHSQFSWRGHFGCFLFEDSVLMRNRANW